MADGTPTPAPADPVEPQPAATAESQLAEIPSTFQAISDYYQKLKTANPFLLRNETFKRIEVATGRPLICYVTKTRHVAAGVPAYIDDSDLTGFSDLIDGARRGARRVHREQRRLG